MNNNLQMPHDNEVDMFLLQPHARELVDNIIFRIGIPCYVPGYQYIITQHDAVRSILSYRNNKEFFIPACNFILNNINMYNQFIDINNNTNIIQLRQLFREIRLQFGNDD
jgi:hypothetical protein